MSYYKKIAFLIGVVVAAVLTCIPRAARADDIRITDLAEAAPTVTYENVTPSQGPILTVPAVELVDIDYRINVNIPTTFSERVDILDPGLMGPAGEDIVSDFVVISGTMGTNIVHVHFESDPPESFMLHNPATPSITEDGTSQMVTGYAPGNLHVFVASDVETVPTPASLAGGLGLFVPAFAMQWWRRRRLAA